MLSLSLSVRQICSCLPLQIQISRRDRTCYHGTVLFTILRNDFDSPPLVSVVSEVEFFFLILMKYAGLGFFFFFFVAIWVCGFLDLIVCEDISWRFACFFWIKNECFQFSSMWIWMLNWVKEVGRWESALRSDLAGFIGLELGMNI